MPEQTPNHGLEVGYVEDEAWDYNDEMQTLEEHVPVVDAEANRGNYEPYTNALFLAEDTNTVALGTGSLWNEIGEIVDPDDLEVGSHNHDDRYALIDHDHDGEYALTGHDHDSQYNDYSFSESHDDLSDVSASDHHTRYSANEARSDIDGADVDIAGNAATATTATSANTADDAELWDGIEVVLNDETPQTNTYLRIETVN